MPKDHQGKTLNMSVSLHQICVIWRIDQKNGTPGVARCPRLVSYIGVGLPVCMQLPQLKRGVEQLPFLSCKIVSDHLYCFELLINKNVIHKKVTTTTVQNRITSFFLSFSTMISILVTAFLSLSHNPENIFLDES